MPEPLDLRHLGHERVIGSYLLETEDGLALQDCGPATCVPELKARLAERGLELARRPAPAALAHPPRPCGRGGRARARAPRAAGARLGDRRAAPRRPEPARAQRAAALRRRLRPALGRARARPERERPRRRRRDARAPTLPEPRSRLPPRLLPRPRRHALRGRRGRRADPAERVRAAADAAARGRPRGLGAHDRRARAARARAPGADPLRRLRGRRAAPRGAAPPPATSGPNASARARPRRSSRPRPQPTSAPTAPPTSRRCRSGSPTPG